MAFKMHVLPHLFDLAIRANEHGGAQDAHKCLAVPFARGPEAQLFDELAFWVGQEWKVEIVFLGKGMVRIDIVGAEAVDLGIERVKLWNSITEFRGFDRSAIGIIFGVDKDNVARAT